MSKIVPIDEEYSFGDKVIITQTDGSGVITFANRLFCEVSGYSYDELIGQPHNILRHPDMPKIVFEKVWKTISSGQTWNGIIKNLRSDGQYYWVNAEILPIIDDEHNITGYISVRKQASHKDIKESQELYEKMLLDQE